MDTGSSSSGKWEAFRRRDAGVLSRLYDERPISSGYAGDGPSAHDGSRSCSVSLRARYPELALGGFEVLPVGGDSAVVISRGFPERGAA